MSATRDPLTSPRQPWDRLLLDCNLATLAGNAGYGLSEDGAIGWTGDTNTFAGPMVQPIAPSSIRP
jgi:imidazolonepropionase